MHNDPDDFFMPNNVRGIHFLDNATRFNKMLDKIDRVTKALQARKIFLAEAQGLLNFLVERIQEGRDVPGNRFYGCTLGSTYIGSESGKLVSKHFHNGVIKIQRGNVADLTPDERHAVESLLVAEQEDSDNDEEDEEDDILSQFNKRQKMETALVGQYMNCDFVLGSAAEVERVWSHAELILRKARYSMTPYLFESLLFLKINKRFWDQGLVTRAVRAVQQEASIYRFNDELRALDLSDDEYE